jgi:AcrR family transcriptional regulator
MGIAERRTRHRASLRREILDAARTLFIEEGYERVSMRKLAERIEYSPTTIYLHFKDKAELFHAVCDETFGQLTRKLNAIAKKGGDPVETLREGLRTYARFALKHKEHYTVAFLLPRNPIFPFADSTAEAAFQVLRDGVTACVRDHRFRPVEVEPAAQTLWAATHGVVALLIAKKGFPFIDANTLIDETIDTMLRGLARS